MDKHEKQALGAAEEAVSRAKDDNLSKQPRFAVDGEQFFASVYQWVKKSELDAPVYSVNSRARDNWLRQFVRLEPHLIGVINSVVSIDKNRGWSLVGGRNQVYRYMPVMHNWSAAPGLSGWRPGTAAASAAYYTTDLGTVIELGRDGKNGPVRAFYHTDPGRCNLTGKADKPLRYYPPIGKVQDWPESDYMRITSLPDTSEDMRGLGFCAVSRCLELATLMVAVYEHDKEMLGARAPKGLLLIHGITEDQWKNAMVTRKAALDSYERQYYGGVAVLASSGTEQIEATLIALSSLPAGFDLKVFTDLLMYGYALCFGYDPSEFWPVQFGSLGRGTESQVQHQKATGKGGIDFALGLQDQLMRSDVLPPTIHFEFDQRDESGELLQAQVIAANIDWVVKAYTAGLKEGAPLVNLWQARTLLAEKGFIPREWTEIEEDTEGTDTDLQAEMLLSRERVQRAISRYPDEEIVRYRFPARGEKQITVIYDPTKRRVHKVTRPKRRADDPVLYADPDDEFTITESDVTGAIREGRRRLGDEFAELLEADPMTDEEMTALEGAQ